MNTGTHKLSLLSVVLTMLCKLFNIMCIYWHIKRNKQYRKVYVD
jgi:hypothetical protein